MNPSTNSYWFRSTQRVRGLLHQKYIKASLGSWIGVRGNMLREMEFGNGNQHYCGTAEHIIIMKRVRVR